MPNFEHPLSLLDDPPAYVAWQREVGAEEAKQQIIDATRAHMQKHGVRSVLDVAEKIDHANAFLEEFTA